MRCKCGRRGVKVNGVRVDYCARHPPKPRAARSAERGPSPLFVMPDAPEIIEGVEALAKAIDRNEQLVTREYLPRDFDPIPARWTLGGLQVVRARLELWCARQPYQSEPKEGIAVLRGEAAMAQAIGMGARNFRTYLTGQREEGHGIRPPVMTQARPVWCYTEALRDWVTSLSMSFVMRTKLRKDGRLTLVEPFIRASFEGTRLTDIRAPWLRGSRILACACVTHPGNDGGTTLDLWLEGDRWIAGNDDRSLLGSGSTSGLALDAWLTLRASLACEVCGDIDCAGTCSDCGSSLCAGEAHDELCAIRYPSGPPGEDDA